TLLRLAEQYLIKAEANANLELPDSSIDDINTIRKRAGLNEISYGITKDSILHLIENERRHEFFAESGHRWFDLKRTGEASLILSGIKGSFWQQNDTLYPIPSDDIKRNSNLKQNPGYLN
ncbi:MAG: RagB/SusD family nutrient uptake outer membrane protein, partial [Chitinophagaceae bacterium]|nr:RagB/SusD family nutrient uptake outer membrane protein [Chitinophagaceae bacterium]